MNDIIKYIPFGSENAISKAELKQRTGLTERTICQKMKQANFALTKQGQAIIATSRHSGYWISDDLGELKAYVRESEKRSKSLQKNNKPIYNLIQKMERIEQQTSIFDREETPMT